MTVGRTNYHDTTHDFTRQRQQTLLLQGHGPKGFEYRPTILNMKLFTIIITLALLASPITLTADSRPWCSAPMSNVWKVDNTCIGIQNNPPPDVKAFKGINDAQIITLQKQLIVILQNYIVILKAQNL